MPSPAIAGTDASRPRSRILTPSSEGILTRDDGSRPRASSPETRKRKRADSVAMDHMLKPSIALKPHPPNLHVQPRILQPLMVLRRQNLSLSYIDFNATDPELSPGRLFEAHVKILDLESRVGSTPVVLLARYESSRNVYALERQSSGLYLTCRIGSWVDLEELAKQATAICAGRLRPISRPESRQSASTALTTPHLHKEQKVKRAAIEAIQSLVRKRPRSQSVSTFDNAARPEEPAQNSNPVESQLPSPILKNEELPTPQIEAKPNPATPVTASKPKNLSTSPPQQTADKIFETIRTQYFEALYRSMGSLAYFAKGPLSRARSAFHLDLESNLDMGDLIDFLKSLVLTTVLIDKKFRETMPHIIAKMKNVMESSDEGRKKKRRTKKMKLGKDGLYPYEEEHIQKWWIANKPELKDDETNVSPQQIKSLASMLRTRETQLQMIIIFEILALTPLRAADDGEDSILPPLPGAAEFCANPVPSLAKKRNKHNLPVLIDVHADRLTIWQSTASDEQLLLEDSQVSRTPEGGQIEQKASSEPLKDFCVDVIVPFFSARLPELCDSINRKLGGPVIVKPSKSRSVKRSASKRDQKPGAVTKRPSLGQQPRTLQRALSTEQHRRSVSRGPSNMIALMRSATSTSLSGVKREGSEPAILKGDPDLLNRRSGPLSRNTSMTNLDDNKATKKAIVEAELKEAISTLRRPNRGVVSKELVDAAERRTSTGLSAKKMKRPARGSLGASIVKATPTNNRFKDMFAKASGSVADIPIMSTEEVIPPSSLPSRIPSTGLRGGHADPFTDTPSRPLDRIDSTPTKGSRFLDRFGNDGPSPSPWSSLNERRRPVPDDEFVIPGSAIKDHRIFDSALPKDEGIFATPVKATAKVSTETEPFQDAIRTHRIFDSALPKDEGIFATPVKANAKMTKGAESMQDAPVTRPLSIYQKLGWDDDLDDL